MNSNVYKPDELVATYACPCCDYRTLRGRGNYEICMICFWEDDGQDDHNADKVLGGPNYTWSLTAARQQFVRTGACRPEDIAQVRKPTPSEMEERRSRTHRT